MKPIFNVPFEQFLKIEKPEIAYILGLLWADGHISFIQFAKQIILSSTPPDIFEFQKIFNRVGKWNFYSYKDKKHPNWKPKSILSTNNTIVAPFLKEKGYCSKSGESANLILDCIPKSLQHYWFRGLFDGDGCLYINPTAQQVNIAGPYEQNWDFLENILNELGINFKVKRNISSKGHKGSCIRITNRKGCLKFLNYIYKNSNKDKCFLSRKYNKYLELIDFDKKMSVKPSSINNCNLGIVR